MDALRIWALFLILTFNSISTAAFSDATTSEKTERFLSCSYSAVKVENLGKECQARPAELSNAVMGNRIGHLPIGKSDRSLAILFEPSRSLKSHTASRRYRRIAETCEQINNCPFAVSDMGPFASGASGCIGDLTYYDLFYTIELRGIIAKLPLFGWAIVCEDQTGAHILVDHKSFQEIATRNTNGASLDVIDYFHIPKPTI